MEELKELVWIINKGKLRSLQRLSQPLEKSTKLGQLYHKIAEEQVASDQEAYSSLYKGEGGQSAYRKLKLTLRERLVSVLFLMDASQASFTSYQRAYYESCKNWAAVKMLLGRNARKTAIKTAKRALRQAEKYEFSAIGRDITDVLRFHYGAIEGDFNNYEHYNKLFEQYDEQARWETKAKGLYLSLIIHFVNDKSHKNEIGQRASIAYGELQNVLAEHQTHDLHLYAFLIRLVGAMAVNDYEQALKVCGAAVSFFEKKPFKTQASQQIFSYQQLECYTQLRRFEEGQQVAERCLASLEEGSFNWFKYLELYFFLSMHTWQYQQAYEVFLKAVDNKRFKALPDNQRELWSIYEAYLHYLKALGKFEAETEDKRFNKFRLGKFLNDTPIYSQDKRGVNISILLLQLLFFIYRKQYDKAESCAYSLKQYNQRYLDRNQHFRSSCLINMLAQIPKAGFHLQAAKRKAEKYYQQLIAVPVELSSQSNEVEILPYERIWQLVLESLDIRIHKQKQLI
jgi:hypothetical protein